MSSVKRAGLANIQNPTLFDSIWNFIRVRELNIAVAVVLASFYVLFSHWGEWKAYGSKPQGEDEMDDRDRGRSRSRSDSRSAHRDKKRRPYSSRNNKAANCSCSKCKPKGSF